MELLSLAPQLRYFFATANFTAVIVSRQSDGCAARAAKKISISRRESRLHLHRAGLESIM
jgi:hypothetical protein